MNIYHGKIISLDKDNNVYNYLVEDHGRIVYLGDSLPPEYSKNASTVELGKRALIPSFGDGHMHFSNWALIAVSYFDVREARDIRELQEIIRKYMTQNEKIKAVIAFGVSKHSVKEKRLISRQELDEVCPDKPLIIICYDGHSAVCNTKMLEKFPGYLFAHLQPIQRHRYKSNLAGVHRHDIFQPCQYPHHPGPIRSLLYYFAR